MYNYLFCIKTNRKRPEKELPALEISGKKCYHTLCKSIIGYVCSEVRIYGPVIEPRLSRQAGCVHLAGKQKPIIIYMKGSEKKMKTIWKRSLSMFLAFVMVFGMIPVNAFAVEEEFVEEILEEEIFEEEFIEEEIVEEIVEEVFEEEIVEEEIVEEIFEEEILEETPVEETPAEEPKPVEVVGSQTSDNVAAEAAVVKSGEYTVWLNDNNLITELISMVRSGEKIRTTVLKTVVGEGTYTDDDVVVYTVSADKIPDSMIPETPNIPGFEMPELDDMDVDVTSDLFNKNEEMQAIVAADLMEDYAIEVKVNDVVCTIVFEGKCMNSITVHGTDKGAVTVSAAEVLDEGEWFAKVADALYLTAYDPVKKTEVTLDAADYKIVVDAEGYDDYFLAPSFDPEKDSVEEMKADGYLMLLVKVTDTEKFDLSYMEKDDNGDYVLNDQGFPVVKTEEFVFEVDATLEDSRAVCYDLYINADAEELVDGYYLEGTEAPKAPQKDDADLYAWVYDPYIEDSREAKKKFYDLTWQEAVDEDNENFTTYMAVWTPQLDNNQTGVADQEEKFTINFVTKIEGKDKTWDEVPWGTSYTDYNGVNLIPDMTTIGADKNFDYWTPFNPEGKTVEAPAYSASPKYNAYTIRFDAEWTDKYTVKFRMPGSTATDDALTDRVVRGEYAVNNPITEEDPWVWDGYYVKHWVYAHDVDAVDDDNNAVNHEAGEIFDFASHKIYANIELEPVFFVDRNENRKEDNTNADPLYTFEWIVEGETVCDTDWLSENEGEKPTVEYYKGEVVVEKKIFNGWDTNDTDPYNIIYTAKFLEDKNENGVNDELEAYKLTVKGAAGEAYLVNGETVITELEGIYDSTKTLTVVATPVVEDGNSVTYVDSIVGAAAPDYDEDFVATATVTAPKNVVVNFKSVAIESKGDTAVLDVHRNGEAYSDEEVYDAAISAPAYNENMVVEYMTRASKPVTIDMGTLLPKLDDMVREKAEPMFKQYFDHKVEDGVNKYYYTLTYAEAWGGLDTERSEMNAQQALDLYFNDLMERGEDYLLDLYVKDTLKETLEAELAVYVNELSGIHAFGEGINEVDPEDPMYIENLRVTYTDNERFSVSTSDITLEIKDSRHLTYIDVSGVKKNFTYGETPTVAVGAKVLYKIGEEVFEVENATIKAQTDMGTKPDAGEYNVYLTFETTEDYKGCEGSYTVVVGKADTTITLDPKVVAIKGDKSYNDYKERATPKSDAQMIHIVAGMDLESADIKIENGTFTLPNIKAWISLPDKVYELVELANNSGALEKPIVLEDGNFYLSDLEELLKTAKVDGAEDILNAMKEVTSMLGNKQEEAEEMSIYVDFVEGDDEMFPEEIGAYINAAMVFDDNYNSTAMAKGVLVIAPAVALPNSGIQLVAGDATTPENLYEFTLEEATALKVLGHEDCPVQYYGFTYSGELYLSVEAPTSAGLYVASAIYEGGTESGSDSAIIMIASGEGAVEIGSKTVKENGEAQAPSVSNTGAYTLISVEADANKELVTAKVSIPDGAKKMLKKLGVEITDGTTANLDTFIGKLDAVEVKFDEVVENIKPVLEKVGVTEGIDDTINTAKAQIQSYVDTLKTELAGLKEYGNVQIVFTSAEHNAYNKAGVYFYAAIVTDPDYLPAVDAGYLVIENADFAVEDKTVTYEAGKQQDLLPTNDAGRGYITLIANEDKSELNLILDGEYEELVLNKLAEHGYVIKDGATTTIGNLKSKADAEKIADVIIDAINERAAGKLKSLLAKVLKDEAKANDLYNAAIAKLEAKLAPMTQQIIDAIYAHITISDDAKISLNAAKPIEPGKYQFYYLSYAVAHGSATLTIEEKVENPYDFGQTSQVYLIEPWALRANLRLYHMVDGERGARLTPEEMAEIDDYGVYFVRESDLGREGDVKPEDLTNKDIIENEHVVLKNRENGGSTQNTSSLNCFSSDFDEGIYTYQLSDSIFALYYIVEDGQIYFDDIKEKNLSKIVKDGITGNYLDTEKAIFKEMNLLEQHILDYRGSAADTEVEFVDVPTLGENPLTGTVQSATFGHTMNVLLLEPWAIRFNGKITMDQEYEDYGVVVYYDTEGELDAVPTAEELLQISDARVFSNKNGDVTAIVESDGRTKISAEYTKGLYTYQMKKSAYVMFYLKDAAGNLYCGNVKERSIKAAIESRLSVSGVPESKEGLVLQDMLNLYTATVAHRGEK